MADMILKGKRKQFVCSVGIGTMNGLLDELLEKKVLTQEEVMNIRCKNVTITDKARALVDALVAKGPQACQIFTSYICEEDCHLAGILGLSSGQQTDNNSTAQVSQEALPFPSALIPGKYNGKRTMVAIQSVTL